MKIGILLTGHAPEETQDELGDYDQMFAQLLAGHGFEFIPYAVVDNVFPDGPDSADGWLITGSKHGAYEDHDWIAPLEQFIRDVQASGRPMAGICFGHQIVAQALGGKVEKFSGGWAVGRTEYQIEGRSLMLNAWHQDQVTKRPEGAKVIGENAFCRYAALQYGENIYTVQPHPEFNGDFVKQLAELRGRGKVPDDQLASALQQVDMPDDNPVIAARIANLFKRGA